jgi:hypothetical protein
MLLQLLIKFGPTVLKILEQLLKEGPITTQLSPERHEEKIKEIAAQLNELFRSIP